MKVTDGSYLPAGYEKITGLSAVKGLTRTTTAQKKATAVLLKTETQPIRWRDDGTNPTATDGILLDIGDEFWYAGDLAAIKFIETAVSATLHISMYR